MAKAVKQTAVAYYRTSSAANAGPDKDSEKRQREACHAFAKLHGFEIVKEYYDAAVSGADPVMERKGFAEMLQYMLGNGARTILVENASRFARDLAVQITGHDLLKAKGITLIPVDAPDHFTNETPTAVMVRQILGAVSQFEKAALVEKLRKARQRKRATSGRCEGRKPVPADTIALAKKLNRQKKNKPSLRAIAKELAAQGHFSESGKEYGPESIKHMLAA